MQPMTIFKVRLVEMHWLVLLCSCCWHPEVLLLLLILLVGVRIGRQIFSVVSFCEQVIPEERMAICDWRHPNI